MSLTIEVKQKNEQLLLQALALQNHLHERVNAPRFSSFFVTFGIAPLLVGVVAGIVLAPKGAMSRRLCHLAFPGLRLWPFF